MVVHIYDVRHVRHIGALDAHTLALPAPNVTTHACADTHAPHISAVNIPTASAST